MYKIADLALPRLSGAREDNRREMFSRFMALIRPWLVSVGSALDIERVFAKFALPTSRAAFFQATSFEVDLMIAFAEYFNAFTNVANNDTSLTENSKLFAAQLNRQPWTTDTNTTVPLEVRQNLDGSAQTAVTFTLSGAGWATVGITTGQYDIDTVNAAVVAAGLLETGESAVELGINGITYRKELFLYLAGLTVNDTLRFQSAMTIMPESADSPGGTPLLSVGDALVAGISHSTVTANEDQYPGMDAGASNILAVALEGDNQLTIFNDVLMGVSENFHGRHKSQAAVANGILVMAGFVELIARGEVVTQGNQDTLEVDLRARGLYANVMDGWGYRGQGSLKQPGSTTSALVATVLTVGSQTGEYNDVIAQMTLDFCRLRNTALQNIIDATAPTAIANAHFSPAVANIASKWSRYQHTVAALLAHTNFWNTTAAARYPNTTSILTRLGWGSDEIAETIAGAGEHAMTDPAVQGRKVTQATIAASGYTPANVLAQPQAHILATPGHRLPGHITLENPSGNPVDGQASVALQVNIQVPPAGLSRGRFTITLPSGAAIFSAATFAGVAPDTVATIAGVGTNAITVTFENATDYAAGALVLLNITIQAVAAGREAGGAVDGVHIGFMVESVWAVAAAPAVNLSSTYRGLMPKIATQIR